MKLYLVWLLVVANLACGLPIIDDVINDIRKSPEVKTTDPAFNVYIDQLPITVKTPIVFGKMDKKFAGVCYIWANGYREINIRKEYWDIADDKHRLELIAHEVNHCDRNLGHNNALRDDGCPVSVMYFANFGGVCWDIYYEEYMGELL